MGELLREHALINLWCEPIQDRQYVISPARLTPAGGSFRSTKVLWEQVPLPNYDSPGDRGLYHVYQIGQIDPEVFNITDLKTEQWRSLQDLTYHNQMVIDVILLNGAILPRHECWLRRNSDNNLILAVRAIAGYDMGLEDYTDPATGITSPRSITLDNQRVYIRFYSNARFDSELWMLEAIDPRYGLRTVVTTVKTQSDFTQFIADCDAVISVFGNQGKPIYYTDGMVTSRPTGWSTSFVGKTFSFVWDSTVKSVEFFPLNTTPIYSSHIDVGFTKYLLLGYSEYGMIDFHDDVDFYVVQRLTLSSYKGVYLHRFYPNTVRQVTHNAYAVKKSVIDELRSKHSFLTSSDVEIMMVVRDGGMHRGLFPQHNRVEELYKLSRSQILTAMTNVTSVPEWHVANLEDSYYTAVMSAEASDITDVMVENAYGYNAATYAICNPQSLPLSTDLYTVASVPPMLCTLDKQNNVGVRTIFGYENGVLLGYHSDNGRYQDIPLPAELADSDQLEAFNYKLSTTTDGVIYGQDVVSHDLKQYGFRCYICPKDAGVPTEEWEDVTGTHFYIYDEVGDVGNGHTPSIVWNSFLLAFADVYWCVKVDKTMHIQEPDVTAGGFDGYMKILMQAETTWLGTPVTRRMSVQPAVIDVFLQGRPLVEDIDFYVEWPYILIVRKPEEDIAANSILIRTYGLPNPSTVEHYKPRDVGFVKGGLTSNNDHYDIRNDRNIRVTVGGYYKTRSQVKFSEEGSGTPSVEGRPYGISDYIIPVNNFTSQDTIPYRELSLNLDDRVMAYLTPLLPEPYIRHPMIATERWAVFSPFCSAVIFALLNGDIDSVPLSAPYTSVDIEGWVAPYMHLLSGDPCVRGYNEAYIHVNPHPLNVEIELTVQQYLFVDKVITQFLNGKTDLSYAVKIG